MTSAAPIEAMCMACTDSTCNFKSVKMYRRPLGDEDIKIDMKYCGVCHSDLHCAAGHLESIQGKREFPIVPGHELSGVVSEVGKAVKGFAVGDTVGVGCMVDSCLSCSQCTAGREHKCLRQITATYQGTNKHGRAETYPPGQKTVGGYTSVMVVNYRFAVHIPASYPLEMAGPVMCAGVTMYSPLAEYGVKVGSKVGIVGLGGLGQMGIRIAKAMGAEVTVVSRSLAKKDLAKRCGADHFITTLEDQPAVGQLDLILNTIPFYHEYWTYQRLLHKTGVQVLLGLHKGLVAAVFVNLITFGHSRIKMSGIGSIKETQEVIDLCDKFKIYPDISVVPVTELNSVYQQLDKSNESGVRYVLDLAGSLQSEGISCSSGPPQLAPNDSGITLPSILTETFSLLFSGRWW